MVDPQVSMDASPLNRRNTSTSGLSSHFENTVTLEEWWLIKSDNNCNGKSLGVAGYIPSDQRIPRVFHSAPVIKRPDILTIETSDAVTVLINGDINKTRTLENGFPPEIFDHFVLGFPFYWKQCEKRWCEVAANSEADRVKTYADTIHKIGIESTAAVSNPLAEKDLSDVGSSACEEVNVEDDSSPQGPLKLPEEGNEGHTSLNAVEFYEGVSHDGSRDFPSSPSFHTTSASSLQDVAADGRANTSYIVDSPVRTGNLETNTAGEKRPTWNSNSKVPSVNGVVALNYCSSEKIIGDGRDNVVQLNVSTSNQKTRSQVKKNKKLAAELTKPLDEGKLDETVHQTPPIRKSNSNVPSVNEVAVLNRCSLEEVIGNGKDNVVHLYLSTSNQKRSQVKRNKKSASKSTKLLDEGKLDGTVHQTPPRKSNIKISSVNGVAALNLCSSEEVIGNGRDHVGHLNVSKSNQRTASRSKVKKTKKLASESTKPLDEGKLDEAVNQTPVIWKSNSKFPSVNGVPALNLCSSEEVIDNGRDNVVNLNVSKSNQKSASRSKVKGNKKLASKSTKPLDEGKLDGAVHQTPPLSTINERDMGHLNVSKFDQNTAAGSTVTRNKKLRSESTMVHDEGKKDGAGQQTKVSRSRRTNKTSETANIINNTDGGSGVKKAKKRIHFETPVSPNTAEGKTRSCLRSPESLNLKRSRSGRLLMPTLEFWRNQSPVYDGDRKVIGILEELDSTGKARSRGSRSEPVKKKPKAR